MKRTSFLSILLVTILPAKCQTSFDTSYKFLQHLNEIGAFEEGVYFINKNINRFGSTGELDTLNYLRGIFLYRLRSPAESIGSLSKVGNSNENFKVHSTFLNSFQHAYLRDSKAAELSLNALPEDLDPLNQELKLHELAGISLLKRDFSSFETYASQFSEKYFQISPFQDRLKKNKEGLQLSKRKSPFLAGVLSGIIPGSGKFYVGKVGEGYTTLLLSTILGLQVREAYKKDGASSFRFKLFTGLFSTLYVANIWGSVLSVKIYKDDFNNTFDDAILLNMHVPLRTIFD